MNNNVKESLIDYKKPFDIKVAGLKQKFANDFNYKAVNTSVLVKMKDKNTISDRDLEIAKFLFRLRFATLNQIHRFLGCTVNKSNLKNRLDKLVQYRVINKFNLVSVDGTQEESLGIYCLDLGGRDLLASYSTELIEDWNTSLNMKSPELVGENLLATEIYLRLHETCGDNLFSFNLYPSFRCGDKTVTPHFKCTVLKDGKKINFIGDIVRDYHFPDTFANKVEKIESILNTNAWKKYYREEAAPILLVFANEDRNVKEAAETIRLFTRLDLKRIRFSTDERIKEPLGERGTFLKYEPKSSLDNTMVLKTAQISIF